jgi:peroxiredoxin
MLSDIKIPRKIAFKGSPLTLVGRVLKSGVAAADFRVTTQDLTEIGLSDFKDKIKVLTSFPSLDTPVCDLQVKEFNKRVAGLSEAVVILGISKDLPFAQKRFCETFVIGIQPQSLKFCAGLSPKVRASVRVASREIEEALKGSLS